MLHPAHLTALEAYFDAARVKGRSGQNVRDNAMSQPPAALIFFQYDVDLEAWSDVVSVLSVHTAFMLPRNTRTALERQKRGGSKGTPLSDLFPPKLEPDSSSVRSYSPDRESVPKSVDDDRDLDAVLVLEPESVLLCHFLFHLTQLLDRRIARLHELHPYGLDPKLRILHE